MDSAPRASERLSSPFAVRRRTPAAWAFEFLRRNEQFQSVVARYGQACSSGASKPWVCEVVEAPAESISAFAEFGVLFADRADVEIDAAHVFWSPHVNPAIIDVRVVAEFPQADGAMFRLHSIADRVIRLASADMHDQLLVIDGARQVQINCIDGDIAAPGCVLVPQIAPDRNINAQMLSIRRLLGTLSRAIVPGKSVQA